MATHKKSPAFIRIIANKKFVVCVNPLQLSSFQIIEKAKITVKKGDEKETIEADTLKLFFPSGTGLSYSVGIDMTEAEFAYVCHTLLEFLYLNESEFNERSKSIEAKRMAEWNEISAENSKKADTPNEV